MKQWQQNLVGRLLKVAGACGLTMIFGAGAAAEWWPMLDDFERPGRWEVKEWGDQAELTYAGRKVTQGKKALQVSFTEEGRKPDNKGIFIRRPMKGLPDQLKQVQFDLFVPPQAKNVQVAIGIESDAFYESPKQSLKPGWNKDLTFDLRQANWKTAASNWQFTQKLTPKAYIGSLFMIFYLGDTPRGSFYMDDLRSAGEVVTVRSANASLWQVKKATNPPQLTQVEWPNAAVSVYEPVEIPVGLQGTVYNPYNPDEIALNLLATGPEGQKLTVPGFLKSGKVSLSKPVADGQWAIRFAPPEAGKWQLRVQLKTAGGNQLSKVKRLTVEPAAKRGFVRVDPQHPRYFMFDNREFYYPLGKNIGWDTLDNYENYFKTMQDEGQNWARVWMAHWSFGIEWKQMGYYPGPGNYNQHNAQRLDRLMELASQYGVYIQLVSQFHGAFSTKVNPEWQNHPYNAANGGFLAKPQEFFTHPKAKELYKRRLRYMVARWGHHTHLMAWEFFNEINFADNWDQQVDYAWHKEMSRYLKDLDPYKHLVTTSYYDYFNEKTYALDTIDFTQYHAYRRRVYKTMSNVMPRVNKLDKPFFFAEFGSDSRDGEDDKDKEGVFIHAGLWAQLMQPVAGNAMPWWWNTHIAPNKLDYHFGAVARFAKDLDRRQLDLEPISQKLSYRSANDAEVLRFYGLKGERYAIGWVADALGMHFRDRREPRYFEHVTIAVDSLQDGTYTAEFWDTYKGEVASTATVRVQDGRLNSSSTQSSSFMGRSRRAAKVSL
jgi:hypothetical protein